MSYLPVFITNAWVDNFRSPSARIARFLPRVQCVLYHSLQHLCLILLQSLCNTAYFCRWCCDRASLSSRFLAMSTKAQFSHGSRASPPNPTSLPKGAAYHPQAPSPNKAQRYQTCCSVAGDLLSTVQTSGPGQWHRMKPDSPHPLPPRERPRPPHCVSQESLPRITGTAHKFKR